MVLAPNTALYKYNNRLQESSSTNLHPDILRSDVSYYIYGTCPEPRTTKLLKQKNVDIGEKKKTVRCNIKVLAAAVRLRV